jgi:5-methylcytosine-specific restriction endonuclease McrA
MKASSRKAAYDKKYNATPEHIAERSQRNKARRAYEKTHGNLPTSTDVDHKRPIDLGGKNTASNLRAVGQSENSAWRKKHPKAYGK